MEAHNGHLANNNYCHLKNEITELYVHKKLN